MSLLKEKLCKAKEVSDFLESKSENNGLSSLTDRDKSIYSVGISTGGSAEIRMVTGHKERRVIASTIDPAGIEFAQRRIQASGLTDQIDVKLEDVAKSLPYPDQYFDFIYARLVLHYLTKAALSCALAELYRILRRGGKMFVVVRSIDCPEALDKNARFDAITGLTTYSSGGQSFSRYFHSKESIQNYLSLAGFSIKHIDAYQEQLCVDFQRLQPASQIDSLIEVLATK